MTPDEAIRRLDETCRLNDLEKFRQVVDGIEPELTPDDSVPFLLHACDILSSHDFGHHQVQWKLTHRYARLALTQNMLTSLERELRILAHIQHDHKRATESEEDWRARRLSHSRRWLHALILIDEACENFEIDHVPHLTAPPPEPHLPAGIHPDQISEPEVRTRYLDSIEINRKKAQDFTLRWRLRQLQGVYGPIGARYILSAYGQAPFNLEELATLLNQFVLRPKHSAPSQALEARNGLSQVMQSSEPVTPTSDSSATGIGSSKPTANKGISRPRKDGRRPRRKKRRK